MRLVHCGLPDFRWQGAARRLLRRAVVVIAEPDGGRQVAGVADEPGIAEVLAGTRLAARRALVCQHRLLARAGDKCLRHHVVHLGKAQPVDHLASSIPCRA
ncbi:hypothetical protein V6L77_12205 [Pannonibacter sp. Pt2-lr]